MSRLIQTLRDLRTLDWHQRRVYLWLLSKRVLGRRRDALPSAGNNIKKVLFVCHGNIMRSAMAEAYFRKLAASATTTAPLETFSAGVFATPGRAGDSRARQVAASMGVSLEKHIARALSVEDVTRADLVCLMDSVNETVCISRHPAAESKVVLLGAFGRGAGESLDITDPFLGNSQTVRACFQRVARAVDALYAELTRRADSSA